MAARIWPAIVLAASLGCDVVTADPARVQSAVSSAPPPATQDWPAFRGPHRNGISTETGWNARWPAEGPRRLWTAQVGLGYSSFAVAGGKAYTLGNHGGQETVWCFDAETGKVLWSHSYACALIDYLHPGGPGATPTIDGDTAYTLSKEGHLHALDTENGGVRWLVHLPKDLGVPTAEWGFTSSPLVFENLLILDVGGLAAFDKKTGKLAWRSMSYRVGYGSPVHFAGSRGEPLVAALTNDCLVVVDPHDGKELANYPWTSSYVTSGTTPLINGRTIFISTGYDTGCALLEFADNKLTPLFRNEEMSNHMATCVLRGGHLYGIDGNSHTARQCKLVCLDITTGKRTWEQRGFGCGAVTLADDKLLIQADEGELIVAEARPDAFVEISRTEAFEGRTWTTPVLCRGRIYCRCEAGEVVCLDVRK